MHATARKYICSKTGIEATSVGHRRISRRLIPGGVDCQTGFMTWVGPVCNILWRLSTATTGSPIMKSPATSQLSSRFKTSPSGQLLSRLLRRISANKAMNSISYSFPFSADAKDSGGAREAQVCSTVDSALNLSQV